MSSAPPGRPRIPVIMPYTVPLSKQPTRRSSGGCEHPRAALSWRRSMRRRRSATAPSASDEPSAGQAPVDPNLMPFLAEYRFKSAADEVPAGPGASIPSRRGRRRIGERNKRLRLRLALHVDPVPMP